MLHPTDQNQQNSLNRSIKLSTNSRPQPVARTLKSTLVNYKDSISHVKVNDPAQNKSMTIERKESGLDNSSQKLDKMIAHQKEINNNWNKQIENQRQSLLATSRQIKRISTQFDQTIHGSNQKSLHFSQSKAEFRTPVLRKDESQYTRTSQNIPNDSLSLQQKANYQMKIQQLMNKVQFLENQCRNLRNQNDHLHRSLGAPKQILQREIENKNFRIDDIEKRLAMKNKQYLDKCVENQKNLAKVTDLESVIRRLESEKQKVINQLNKSKQNGEALSRYLNDSKAATIKVENEKKKISVQLQGEKLKVTNLGQQKKQLQLQLQKISKIKDLVRQMEQSDSDKAEVIKKHIAYEAQLIELNGVMVSNLESHKHDLKVTSDQQHNINKQIQSITQQIAVKMKDVLDQKQRLEDQLAEARAQTEKVRRTMFVGYQQIIAKLKDQLILLKQENVNLSNNSESKITIVKLERQIKLLESKNEDLMGRHKEMQATIQKLQASNLRRTATDISSQTSIKGPEYYDRAGKADLESIIMSYESRSTQLNERIHAKQMLEIELKRKIDQLQNQLRQYRDQAQFSNRKQKSDSDNIKAKLQSMKMQLKSETDSLNRKIQGLEKNITRKNKEIKDKDNFITNYLIQKVKDQINVNQIIQEIDKFFGQVK